MSHDSSGNSCPSSGYIMASVAGIGTHFSTCSIRYADTWVSTNDPKPVCIKDVPAVWMNADSEIAVAQTANGTAQHAQQRMYTDASGSAPSYAPSSSHELWTFALPCFLAGMAVSYLVSLAWHKLRKRSSSPRSKSHADLSIKSSPSPTNAHHSLHVAPSAPNTPMSKAHSDTTKLLGHQQEESAPLTSHHTQYNTRAKRRPSSGTIVSIPSGSFSSSSSSGSMLVGGGGGGPRIPDTIPSESPEA
jgi:hypothetical protein